MKELFDIQQKLNAPKDLYNKFGNYKYRSAETILKAVKPLLAEMKCILLLNDEIKEVGVSSRVYVEATATLINTAGEKVSVKAYAREEETKKGMDASQVTGAASSYARKYALCGLFAIDDGVDADKLNVNKEYTQPKTTTTARPTSQTMDDNDILQAYALPAIEQATCKEELARIYNDYPTLQTNSAFTSALTTKRKALGIKNSNEK